MNVFDKMEIITRKIENMFVTNDDLCRLIEYPFSNALTMPRVKNPYNLLESMPRKSNNGAVIAPKIYTTERAYNIIDKTGTVVFVNMFPSPLSGKINSQKLSILITVGIHNDTMLLDDGSNRFNRIFGLISNRLDGNFWLSDGFNVINKGVKILNTEKNYEMRRLVFETIITNTHNYGKFKESDKFDT